MLLSERYFTLQVERPSLMIANLALHPPGAQGGEGRPRFNALCKAVEAAADIVRW
jgi:hypothetical protein